LGQRLRRKGGPAQRRRRQLLQWQPAHQQQPEAQEKELAQHRSGQSLEAGRPPYSGGEARAPAAARRRAKQAKPAATADAGKFAQSARRPTEQPVGRVSPQGKAAVRSSSTASLESVGSSQQQPAEQQSKQLLGASSRGSSSLGAAHETVESGADIKHQSAKGSGAQDTGAEGDAALQSTQAPGTSGSGAEQRGGRRRRRRQPALDGREESREEPAGQPPSSQPSASLASAAEGPDVATSRAVVLSSDSGETLTVGEHAPNARCIADVAHAWPSGEASGPPAPGPGVAPAWQDVPIKLGPPEDAASPTALAAWRPGIPGQPPSTQPASPAVPSELAVTGQLTSPAHKTADAGGTAGATAGAATECVVCWEEQCRAVLVPCGHLCLCR
jgi:hypothetical protein